MSFADRPGATLPPDPLYLEVIADRITFEDRIEQGEAKKRVLARRLLKRHPALRDRSALEIVNGSFDLWPCCLRGLAVAAQQIIELDGGEPLFRGDPPLRAARAFFDEDLLIAARIACPDGHCRAETPLDFWQLVPAPWGLAIPEDLAEILERPLAETHLHLSGAVPPATFWLPMMLSLLSLERAAGMMADGRADEETENRPGEAVSRLWLKRLGEALVLRAWLAREVAGWRGADHPFHRVAGLAGSFSTLPEAGWEADDWLREARQLFERIGHRGPETATEPPLAGCAIWVDPGGPLPYRDYLSQAVEGSLGVPRGSETLALGERCLLAEALRQMHGIDEPTAPQDRLKLRHRLLRYIRIKQSFLRLLIHTGEIGGLDRFRARFDRKNAQARFDAGPLTRQPGELRRARQRIRDLWDLGKTRYQTRLAVLRWLAASTRLRLLPRASPAALDLRRVEPHLRAAAAQLERRLELRISPGTGAAHGRYVRAVALGIRDALETLESAPPGQPPAHIPQLQVGLVLHLLKKADRQPAEYLAGFQKIHGWLDEHPAWRFLFVGVDAANSELDSPPSRFALAYRWLQKTLREHGPLERRAALALGRTFHVGEDFRDLLTGVRQVAWAVDLLGLVAGDRLGHALAIGNEPEVWYARQGQTFPRLGEHLLDLLWAWRRLRQEPAGPREEKVLSTLGARLQGLGLEARDDSNQHLAAWLQQIRGSAETESGGSAGISSEEGLENDLAARLIPARQGSDLHPLLPDADWIALVRCLQDKVLHDLERQGIAIESNPTSNLLIGTYHGFAEHPVFRFHPIARSAGAPLPLRVSLSTDDPEIFRVSLREEYSALLATALERFPQHGRRDLLDWLDRLRQDGFDSSFLKRTAPAGTHLAGYLRTLTELGPGL